VIVHVGSILHSYTGGESEVEGRGTTLDAVLADLDERFPGIRFRVVDEQDAIRPHVRLFVGSKPARDLSVEVGADDEVHVLAALSGG
jgi:molybdopterin converting factor small subunit